MKKDRFFIFLVIGIAVIVVISFVIVLSNQNQVTYLPDNSPEGVANNYLLAWIHRDYETIENYLIDEKYKPEISDIISTMDENQYSLEDAGVSIDVVNLDKDFATITVTIMHTGNGYDSYRYDYTDSITLVKQNSEWKIKEAPYPFWDWDWYQNDQMYKD
jgi:hypothetical protein